jgi:hypothetical protein
MPSAVTTVSGLDTQPRGGRVQPLLGVRTPKIRLRSLSPLTSASEYADTACSFAGRLCT